MRSKDSEMITDLGEFLVSKHPFSVLQFITGMMIGWTHFEKNKQPSKSDIDLAWNNYFRLLRNSIDKRLLLISNQRDSHTRQKVLSPPPQVYEKKVLDDVIVRLGKMSSDDAINFIVEVTTNWCFSIPINFLPLLPIDSIAENDEAIANAIYEWFVRYCDLWP